MLYISIALFALTAVLGIAILYNWLMKKNASAAVVYSHGIFAAIALVFLVVFAVQNPGNYPKISIILFVVAALGGFYMFYNDLKKKFSPMSVALVHALLAVGGFVMLSLFTFA